MNYYAAGGQAQGLKRVAQDLQDKGRNGDTILAHINPQEAQMLKAAGGSGTINPATGLPEFGMFGIGGGGGFLGTGINKNASDPISKGVSQLTAPISQAFQSGMGAVDQGLVGLDKAVGKTIPGGWGTVGMVAGSAMGLPTYAMTGLGALTGSGVMRKGGNFNLQGALMGGAMAYGMSSLGEYARAADLGTGAAGTPTPGLDVVPPPITPSVAPPVGDFAGSLSDPTAGMAQAYTPPPPPGIMSNLASGNFGTAMGQIGSNISNAASSAYDSAADFANKATTGSTYTDALKEGLENVQKTGGGLKSLITDPKAAIAQADKVAGIMAPGKAALSVGVGAMGLSDLDAQRDLLNQQQAAGAISDADYNAQMAEIEAGRKRGEAAMAKNPYQFAYGGSVDDEPGTDNLASYAMGGYAMGGEPRFLSGGGDGLSDDIPAIIGKDQPARLADGEFVVSSDVVSNLGNGSSKAGAKKLYDMMDRVRKQAHGTTKQIRKVNADKVLPA